MTDKKVLSLILLPMLALTLILGLLVLNSPARAANEASAPAQAGLTAWNPLHNARAMTPGVDGLVPVASAPAAPEAVCTPDVTSMLSYWPLDETSGTAFADVVDGNPGACTNCPTPVGAGIVGGAQQFTSSQLDGIVITESADPNQKLSWGNGESFSFEMWVNFTEDCSSPVANKVFFGRYRGDPGDARWWVGCTPGGFPRFHLRDHETGGLSTTVQITDDVAINDGAWHHVVAVRDASAATNRLYVDGSEAVNGAASYAGGFASIGVISMGYFANSYYFDGKLDEVAVYDKALSATEVANHYNEGFGQPYCSEPPVAQDQLVTTDEDLPVAITLEATDADNDPLTFTVVAQPTHGTLTGTAPALTYTPTGDYNGPDSFTFKATDDKLADSNVATVSITVKPVNDAPVADNQSVTTDEDLAVNITLTATDKELDPLTFTVVAQPAHGTLTGTAPNLIYTPATNYHGPDSFTFKVNDGTVDSNVATVTITVAPDTEPTLLFLPLVVKAND